MTKLPAAVSILPSTSSALGVVETEKSDHLVKSIAGPLKSSTNRRTAHVGVEMVISSNGIITILMYFMVSPYLRITLRISLYNLVKAKLMPINSHMFLWAVYELACKSSNDLVENEI